MTHAPVTHVGRPRVNPWLVVVVLAVALVALGSWVAVDRGTRDEQDNLASSQVAVMLRDRIEAMDAYDAEATAAFYAEDAVMEEYDPGLPNGVVVTKGRERIQERWQAMMNYMQQSGVEMRWGSGIIQIGRFHADTVSFGAPGSVEGQGIAVMELDENGKIAHEWAISGTP
jgi:ketosteroid isomerase-like protein